jgi:ubiquinone/menaquinone biosynthesis C-methylase UbiE
LNTLELGVGHNPHTLSTDTWHDRIKHSPYIDEAWDLNELPWPWKDDLYDKIVAVDVFEHLTLEIPQWLDECWRVLTPQGVLDMRLPAWDNPLSYRDPTHRKIFHEETFYYWDQRTDLFRDFGSYYFEESNKWWTVSRVNREASDLRFTLVKEPTTSL